MEFKANTLSSAAVEVIGQLFTNGPTWDGNIVSKSGPGELFAVGLASRVDGFWFLTEDGVHAASGWDKELLRRRHDQRWYRKAATLD
jgi:hypothetical protein